MEPAAQLRGHTAEVQCLSSPGDARLASGGADGSVRIWDLAAGRATRAMLLPQIDGDNAVDAVCIGAADDAANWVWAATGSHVLGFDLRAPGVLLREPARTFASVASDEIGHLALHEASGVLAAADDAGDVHLIDVSGGGGGSGEGGIGAFGGGNTGRSVLRGAHTSICGWVAFRPGTASECCTAGLDALCVRWDWRAAASLEAWSLTAPVTSTQVLNPRHAHCVSFAPDGGTLALALGDGSLEVRLADGGEPIAAVEAHRAAASQAHFAPQLRPAMQASAASDGRVGLPLVSAGDDCAVRLWSAEGVEGRGGKSGGKKKKGKRSLDGCGFIDLGSATLAQKPNAVAAAADPAGRALVCVATTGEAIQLLRIT